MDLRVTTWFLGMLGVLGRDKGFLCHDRAFFFCPVSRYKFCVVTGFRIRPGCFGSRQRLSSVVTEFSLWVGFPCRDIAFYVKIIGHCVVS